MDNASAVFDFGLRLEQSGSGQLHADGARDGIEWVIGRGGAAADYGCCRAAVRAKGIKPLQFLAIIFI